MKAFVRSTDLGRGKEVDVVAYYEDGVDVPPDAHGPGMSIITVAPGTLIPPKQTPDGMRRGMPRLPQDWEQRSAHFFPAAERTASVYELVSFVIEHGADVSKWPASAKERTAKIKQKWKP